MDLVLGIVLIVLALILGVLGGYFVLQFLQNKKKEKDGKDAKDILEDANKRAEEIINNATVQAKNLTLELKEK